MFNLSEFKRFCHHPYKVSIQPDFLVLIQDPYPLVSHYPAYQRWFESCCLKHIYRLVCSGLVQDCCKTPAHVESLEHFLVRHRPSKYFCGGLDQIENRLRLKIIGFKTCAKRKPPNAPTR